MWYTFRQLLSWATSSPWLYVCLYLELFKNYKALKVSERPKTVKVWHIWPYRGATTPCHTFWKALFTRNICLTDSLHQSWTIVSYKAVTVLKLFTKPFSWPRIWRPLKISPPKGEKFCLDDRSTVMKNFAPISCRQYIWPWTDRYKDRITSNFIPS